MQILIGAMSLGVLAGALTLAAALFDDGLARRIAAILLARAEAREAYRERYRWALGEREREFGLKEITEVQES